MREKSELAKLAILVAEAIENGMVARKIPTGERKLDSGRSTVFHANQRQARLSVARRRQLLDVIEQFEAAKGGKAA